MYTKTGEGCGWSKGLTKETDERVKHNSETKKRLFADGKLISWFKNNRLSKETIEQIRQKRLGQLMGNTNPAKRPEVREKISKKNKIIVKNLWKNPEYRKMMSDAHKGYEMPQSQRDKIGNAQKGEKHWNWQDGISFEPYSIDWTEILRRSIRERDNYICQLCRQYGNTVHHIDYDKKNCNPKNLITLCISCNIKVNKNRKYWTNYFK